MGRRLPRTLSCSEGGAVVRTTGATRDNRKGEGKDGADDYCRVSKETTL